MATAPVLRGLLIIAEAEIGEVVRNDVATAATFKAKTVVNARSALTSIGSTVPHVLVIQAGRVPGPAMQAVKNMAELTASRPVPIVIFEGPLSAEIDKQRTALGIVEVLDGPYTMNPLLDAVKAAVGKVDAARRTNKIRQRLRTASDRLQPYRTPEELQTPEAEAPPPSEDVQDFASDDVAPPAPRDPNKPIDEPTWDGSGG